jgi:hypothetical protein
MSDAPTGERLYVLHVGERVLHLDAEQLLSFARRLFVERELGLPPGSLTEEEVLGEESGRRSERR